MISEKEMNSICYDNGKKYAVKNEKELYLLNQIINQLNKKYVHRDKVVFNGEKLIRFQNKYTQKSYFAKKGENGNLKECAYEDYRNLYEKYNGLQTCFSIEQENTSKQEYSAFPKTTTITQNYSSKSTKTAAYKIVLGIAGIAVSVSAVFAGWNQLKNGKLPQVVKMEREVDDLVEADEQEISDNVQFIIDAINSNPKITEEEKKYIIELFLPIWQSNEEFINIYEIATRMRNLEIVYASEGNSNSLFPGRILGRHNYNGTITNTREEYEKSINNKSSIITVYQVNSFEELVSNEKIKRHLITNLIILMVGMNTIKTVYYLKALLNYQHLE